MTDTKVDEVFKKLTPLELYDSQRKAQTLVDVKKYIDTLGDLNKLTPDDYGNTLLHKFFEMHLIPEVIEIIRYLIFDKGLDVNAKNERGLTAFIRATGREHEDHYQPSLLHLLSSHPKVDLNEPFRDGPNIADYPGSKYYEIVKPQADKRGVSLVPATPEILKNLDRNVGLATKLGREDANAGKSMNQEIIKNYRQKFRYYDQLVSEYMNAYAQTMMTKKGGKSRRSKSKKHSKKSRGTRRH